MSSEHFTTPAFWRHYENLPESIQHLADECFGHLKRDPNHPGLHFKKAGVVWTARVGIHYRAIAFKRVEGYLWFWIGKHEEYDKLLSKLQ